MPEETVEAPVAQQGWKVMTFVRGPDGRDGLWFFSLEADSLGTVVGASTAYGVPYQRLT